MAAPLEVQLSDLVRDVLSIVVLLILFFIEILSGHSLMMLFVRSGAIPYIPLITVRLGL